MCRREFDEIFQALARGEKVLICCKHGKHRTVCKRAYSAVFALCK
jgi:protein tyrosine/serine phosphatase